MTTPTLPPLPSTIANLPLAVTPLAGNEYVPLTQNGVTVRCPANGFTITGPAGPPGPTGATGATGPSGGVANINPGTAGQFGYYATTGGTLSPATIGTGLLLTGSTLSATTTATVNTTGSPASGNLAKFSGATSVTNADLTGDVTTSGGVATTLATVNSNVGSFTNAAITVDAKGRITAASSGNFSPNTYQNTPSAPTGTTNATGVMMGLNGGITPASSGTVMIVISGDGSSTGSNSGGAIQLRYGTGTAPANGAALTGTAIGGKVNYITANNNLPYPFSLNAIITGLTLATAIWVDVSLAAVSASTASIKDISISIIEVK